jgi:hypothetical protein
LGRNPNLITLKLDSTAKICLGERAEYTGEDSSLLQLAVNNDHVRLVHELLKMGINPNEYTTFYSPLAQSILNIIAYTNFPTLKQRLRNSQTIFEMLLKNPNLRVNSPFLEIFRGLNLHHERQFSPLEDILKKLLAKGLNIDQTDEQNNTALLLAGEICSPFILTLLLKIPQVNVNHVNNKNENVLDKLLASNKCIDRDPRLSDAINLIVSDPRFGTDLFASKYDGNELIERQRNKLRLKQGMSSIDIMNNRGASSRLLPELKTIVGRNVDDSLRLGETNTEKLEEYARKRLVTLPTRYPTRPSHFTFFPDDEAEDSDDSDYTDVKIINGPDGPNVVGNVEGNDGDGNVEGDNGNGNVEGNDDEQQLFTKRRRMGEN